MDEGNPLMLKSWIKTRELGKRLRTDRDGLVSFEYVIVAFCIIGAVGAAFSAGAGGGAITTALTSGIATVAALLPAAA
jgi:pilus assembly protein Flp/PilA